MGVTRSSAASVSVFSSRLGVDGCHDVSENRGIHFVCGPEWSAHGVRVRGKSRERAGVHELSQSGKHDARLAPALPALPIQTSINGTKEDAAMAPCLAQLPSETHVACLPLEAQHPVSRIVSRRPRCREPIN